RTGRMPVEKGGENELREETEVGVGLSREETERLMREVSRRYESEVVEVLVWGLAGALGEGGGSREVRIEMEGHGGVEGGGEGEREEEREGRAGWRKRRRVR